jgi:choline dehydrogenase-like flavoprotein
VPAGGPPPDHDVVVVGSGAAGVAAALELAGRGIRPLVLDVGYRKEERVPRVEENLYRYRKRHDTYRLLVGDELQGLSNLLTDRHVPVKLTTPNMEYVTRDAERLTPVDETDFRTVQSFAAGGLANAWGAGLYRFIDEDLEGFPIRARDLEPHFDALTREIGIGGEEDDLAPFFGSTRDLRTPLRLSHNIEALYRGYRRRREVFHRDGFFLGRARVAVLTEAMNGRPAFDYSNLEFWQDTPAIYSPRFTLDKLIAAGRVDYRSGILVESWRETGGAVEVRGRDLGRGTAVTFTARKVLLAAGAINTTRIVLRSFEDTRTELTLLENPALQIPLVIPRSLGRALDVDAFGLVQLNLVWKSAPYGCTVQGSIMEITSPARAEFFDSLPFSARANLGLLRTLLPAMLVLQLFFPGRAQEPSRISLRPDGGLRIQGHPNAIDLGGMKPFLAHLRRAGAYSVLPLIVRVPMGHAIHYAATLPMKPSPSRYQCDPAGRLAETRNVFVADSASFTDLPAKNMSFAMMANAMRIAAGAAGELRGGA